MNSTAPPPIQLKPLPRLFPLVSDELAALIAPIVVYWTTCTFFHAIDTLDLWKQYRIHPPQEIAQRNKCSLSHVLHQVIIEHVLQTAVGLWLIPSFEPDSYGDEPFRIWQLQSKYGVPYPVGAFYVYFGQSCLRILLAIFILDTYQYFLHRLMHSNQFLYRHMHSVHHRLYVPYAYGALYNSALEGFVLDTGSGALSRALVGLSAREAIVFYTLSTLKTVDDHCGYSLPFDPFQILFPNNSVYHDIHHQHFGIKTNFSQPFFIHWDRWLGTDYKGDRGYRKNKAQ